MDVVDDTLGARVAETLAVVVATLTLELPARSRGVSFSESAKSGCILRSVTATSLASMMHERVTH